MRKLKLEDKVRVKSFKEILAIGKEDDSGDIEIPEDGDTFIVPDMKKYCGQEAIISEADGNDFKLSIDDEDWNWTPSMLELIE